MRDEQSRGKRRRDRFTLAPRASQPTACSVHLLDVTLESVRIQGLEELEAAKQFRGHRHDSAPVVELAAILGRLLAKAGYDKGFE